MKNLVAAFALILGGCGTMPDMPWSQGPDVSESTCTASCNAHFEECPKVFAEFPERGAVECPAEHNDCLRTCEVHHSPARPAATSPVVPATGVPAARAVPVPEGTQRTVPSNEDRLRELKRLYDEGLVSDDVYRHRQEAILSEP
ncbi:MAG: hypothetical protein QOD56_2750 [Gammaproteobacteria bacterium]|jgi:hypothetical protein|nr:hypothetical protein [Gammaproteobacteria bacterium]